MTTHTPAFADTQAAQRALAMALPMIEPLMRDASVVGSGFLYIVVLDPTADAPEVLLEYAVGDRSKWDADYAAFARAKATLAWRTRRDGAALQAEAPHLLRKGESLLAGAVWLDGIVVGVSGAHPYYDEAIANCVAGCLRAVAKHRWTQATADRQLQA